MLLLTGEDQLRLLSPRLPPVIAPPRGGQVPPLDGDLSAGRGNLLGGCEADVAHTLELAALLDEALGDHGLPLPPGARTEQVVRAGVLMSGNQFVARALNRDLDLLWFSGHVKTRVIMPLTLQARVTLVLVCRPALLLQPPVGALGPRVEVARDVKTHRPLSPLVPDPAVGEAIFPGCWCCVP